MLSLGIKWSIAVGKVVYTIYIYIYTHLVISRSITTQGSSWIPSVPTKFVIVAKPGRPTKMPSSQILQNPKILLHIYHWWERPLRKSQGVIERDQQRAHLFFFFFLRHDELDLDTVEPDFNFGALADTKVSRVSDVEGSKDTLLSFDSSTHGSSGSARTSKSAPAEFWLAMSTKHSCDAPPSWSPNAERWKLTWERLPWWHGSNFFPT